MRNFAAFSSWFCIFQVSFHAFETVKTAIFVGLGLANFTLVAKRSRRKTCDKVPTPIDDGCSFC